MGIIIEKGVSVNNDENRHKCILDKMEVGDSFLVDQSMANTIRNSAWIYFHRTTDKRFRSTVKGQPAGKVRFWREQ